MLALIAAEVQLPWPLVWLLALAGLMVLVSGSYVIMRGAGTKERITMLNGEVAEWRQAKEDGDKLMEAAQKRHEAAMARIVKEKVESEASCEKEMAVLTSKVAVLENLVTGTSAIKEMTELMLAASEHQHQEVLTAMKAVDSSMRTFADGVWALLGDGDRRRDALKDEG